MGQSGTRSHARGAHQVEPRLAGQAGSGCLGAGQAPSGTGRTDRGECAGAILAVWTGAHALAVEQEPDGAGETGSGIRTGATGRVAGDTAVVEGVVGGGAGG